jgi:hypothetical protein
MMRILLALSFLFIFSVGCTYFGSKNTKLEKQIIKSTQDNVSKAKTSNAETIKSLIKTSTLFEINPELKSEFPNIYSQIDISLKSSNISGSYLDRASKLIGDSEISAIEIRNEVLGLITNNQEYIKFAKSQALEESRLISDKRDNDDKLKGMGQIYEEERNESIIKKIKIYGGIIGGVVLISLFYIYILPLISSVGVIPMALSLVPKKTLVKKVRAANTFLSQLDFMKKQELDKGDTNKVRLIEMIVQSFKDINRKEEDEREHKMTKQILVKNI